MSTALFQHETDARRPHHHSSPREPRRRPPLIHPQNHHAPTVAANYRYFEITSPPESSSHGGSVEAQTSPFPIVRRVLHRGESRGRGIFFDDLHDREHKRIPSSGTPPGRPRTADEFSNPHVAHSFRHTPPSHPKATPSLTPTTNTAGNPSATLNTSTSIQPGHRPRYQIRPYDPRSEDREYLHEPPRDHRVWNTC